MLFLFNVVLETLFNESEMKLNVRKEEKKYRLCCDDDVLM